MHEEKQQSSSFVDVNSSRTPSRLANSLYNELTELVSLVDKKPSSAFTRQGSITYTKKPPRDFFSKKKDMQELVALRKHVENLQKKISKQDELLKKAEVSKNKPPSFQAKLDELEYQDVEKDVSLKFLQQKLLDCKIDLADKQAALEKLTWERMQSNKKVEKLQEKIDLMQEEMSPLMRTIEALVNDSSTSSGDDYSTTQYEFDDDPYVDGIDEEEVHKMEEAIDAYVAAVELAKEKQDEESMDIAVKTRLHLLSYVFRYNTIGEDKQ